MFATLCHQRDMPLQLNTTADTTIIAQCPAAPVPKVTDTVRQDGAF